MFSRRQRPRGPAGNPSPRGRKSWSQGRGRVSLRSSPLPSPECPARDRQQGGNRGGGGSVRQLFSILIMTIWWDPVDGCCQWGQRSGGSLLVHGGRGSASLGRQVGWGVGSEGVPGSLTVLVTSAGPQPQRHEQVKPGHFQEEDAQPDHYQVVEV